ncbi:MAG: 6-phosphofructokinase [Clostridia bacterium]|nr:6-phosphofructokinase [Clostridia bacterium]
MGNNILIGQSGGPTVAINATLSGIVKGCREYYPDAVYYGARNGVKGILNETLVPLNEQLATEEQAYALETTPSAALGSCRVKLPKDLSDPMYDQIFAVFAKYGIGVFFYIGGNDSMDTVEKLSRKAAELGSDLRVVGVPKTIDNDLPFTDHTPGFGSAAKYVATTVQEIACDCAVYSDPSVTIVEIMGRDAGWLTAAAGIPRLYGEDCADLIYLPEVDFDSDRFLEDLRRKFRERTTLVVAVSEGIHTSDGTLYGSDPNGKKDVFGHTLLSGAAHRLCELVKAELGCKSRSVELNVPQRCASHCLSATDISESVLLGKAAVKAVFEGKTGVMITYLRNDDPAYSVRFGDVPVAQVANKTKYVPLEHISPNGCDVSDELLRQIAPLIAGELEIPRRGGLPCHFKVRFE